MAKIIKRVDDGVTIALVEEDSIRFTDFVSELERGIITSLTTLPYVTLQSEREGNRSVSSIRTYEKGDDGYIEAVLADLPIYGFIAEESE